MRSIIIVCLLGILFPHTAYPAGKAKYIVVLVWDGMRPDFVRPDTAPNLHKLAQLGVFFRNHHPVYPSSTEVNAAALATGAYPQTSGLIANKEFRPAINPSTPIGTEALETVRKGDTLTGGNFLKMPTVAEILQRNGHRTVIAGTKPVALLHDRAERSDSSPDVNLFEGHTLPPPILATLTNTLGRFAETTTPRTNRDLWTARALIGTLWQERVPTFSLLWLSEPDYSQHTSSPGTERALAAIRNSDQILGSVVSALKAKGIDDQTDILVVSDHGFSTVTRQVDVAAALQTNGFVALREIHGPPARGDIMVAGNGGSVLLYVAGQDEQVIGRLVNFLQRQEYVGVIFTRRPAPGTFGLDQALMDSPDAPDVVFSMRWSDGKNPSGISGHVFVDAETKQILLDEAVMSGDMRLGAHVTLSPFDLHNTLIAAGPDFRRRFVDSLPTGNVDVAPTILWILGIPQPKPMDGRVLTEALTTAGPGPGIPKTTRIEATHRQQNLVWRQYLRRTELKGVVYFEDGNGAAVSN